MTRKINYEDDLFALSLLVRGLRDIAGLEVDADLFADDAVAVSANPANRPGIPATIKRLKLCNEFLCIDSRRSGYCGGWVQHRIKTLVGITCQVEVLATDSIERTLVGKARRVIDQRPKG